MSNSKSKYDLDSNFASIGLKIPYLLLPAKNIDLTKWAVVACDQYTSDQLYWQEVDQIVGQAESSLRITLPEIFLEAANVEDRIHAIHAAMNSYITDGVLVEHDPALVYVERTTEASGLRQGLIVAVDLEHYDYAPDSTTLIRATEGTIVDRIPPRLRVRKKAALEIPHIMILIDDPNFTVIEPLQKQSTGLESLYEVELIKHGGKLKGFLLDDLQNLQAIYDALYTLFEASKKNQNTKTPLFFAMGDGNHSLATAKAHWVALKAELLDKKISQDEVMKHPARFALAEIVNIHSNGLRFEPIHRAVFSKKPQEFIHMAKKSALVQKITLTSEQDAKSLIDSEQGKQSAVLFAGGDFLRLDFVNKDLLPPAQIDLLYQEFKTNFDPSAKVDFIHGWEDCTKLINENAVACLVPVIARAELFSWVAQNGPLPRKAFSMGEAEEKRYYLEAKSIETTKKTN